MPEKSNQEFWRRKLLAFLHDPPCKCLDIKAHEEHAFSFIKAAFAGEDDTALIRLLKGGSQNDPSAVKCSDHWASAADRFLFPKRLSFDFRGNPVFKHPLGGAEYPLRLPADNQEGVAAVVKILQDAVGGIDSNIDSRRKLFLYWRRWLENAVDSASDSEFARHLAYYPADTRLPDHSIWNHMAVAAAFESCRSELSGLIEPAFLEFQIGPVQDFIAQARSTRDLWSGSYLLSWLVAHAMKSITDALGPCSIIFPKLRGQGVFDLLHKEEIYDNIRFSNSDGSSDSLWDRMYEKSFGKDKSLRMLLSPTLPNRFLALAPADKASEMALKAEKAVHEELKRIGEAVWRADWPSVDGACGKTTKNEQERARFFKQLNLFPKIFWQVCPWDQDIRKTMDLFDKLPSMNGEDGRPSQSLNLKALHWLATDNKGVPVADRDGRYYTDKDVRTNLNNPGFAWPAHYAMANFLSAARRNTREFDQFTTDENQRGSKKDALSGKEEVIGKEELGAINLVKRHFAFAYLKGKVGFDDEASFRKAIRFDSVPEIACGNGRGIEGRDWVGGEVKDGRLEKLPGNPYVAVLAMDGDSMGKWISGVNNPELVEQLSPSAKKYFEDLIPTSPVPKLQRPLSPSFHLQFSEALANFAYYLAERVVFEFDGQLIYAGGDDVLAMLPADKALACAQTLRAVFRGDARGIPEERRGRLGFAVVNDGFVAVGGKYEILVPGPKADVSCGIAVAHCDHPLQHIVKEAQAAERRAKKEYGRSAFALSLLKRGGEIIHWGANWNSGALDLYQEYYKLRGTTKDERKNSPVSAKFPYALAALLAPYHLEKGEFEPGFEPSEIIRREFERILERQIGGEDRQVRESIQRRLRDMATAPGGYLDGIKDKFKTRKAAFDDFTKLFLTAAFIGRGRSKED